MNTTPDTSHYGKCLSMLQNQKRSHMIRFFILLALSIINGYIHIIPMPVQEGLKLPETSFARNAIFTNGFAYAVLAFLFTIAVLVLGLLLEQDRAKLILIPIGICVLCVCTGLFHLFWGIAMAAVLAVGLYESRDAVWLKQQEGYPYFNERFTEQEQRSHTGYEARYDISCVKNEGEMPDIAGACDPANIPKEMRELPAEPDIR